MRRRGLQEVAHRRQVARPIGDAVQRLEHRQAGEVVARADADPAHHRDGAAERQQARRAEPADDGSADREQRDLDDHALAP